jgi:hypothetical protein
MSGRGCASFWDGSELWWMVWADTYPPYSYQIYTSAEGWDRCATNPYQYQGVVANTVYNASYGTSNPSSTLNYQDCPPIGHTYKVRGYHLRMASGGGYWEGSEGFYYIGPNP